MRTTNEKLTSEEEGSLAIECSVDRQRMTFFWHFWSIVGHVDEVYANSANQFATDLCLKTVK